MAAATELANELSGGSSATPRLVSWDPHGHNTANDPRSETFFMNAIPRVGMSGLDIHPTVGAIASWRPLLDRTH